ncbi:UNVERIFIED_CONTAM: hypothetical protein Slati_3966300 [Sesamum latifolium]|uniref:DUF4283 domain-containing protein n=1 Tax=Sesamum latifolium TaxID=2727402 RepID=A0AAW2TPG9_9LAMI
MGTRVTETDIGRFTRCIRLREDEEGGTLLPDGLWNLDTDSFHLCLEWKLSSYARVEFFSSFNHTIDRDRALKGCPWNFDKHVLILNSIGVDDNPMQVDLNRCDFYVHIHDLPLSRMNLGVATIIGNQLGIFRDMEMDEAGRSWGSSLRIREEFEDPGEDLQYGPWLREPIPLKNRMLTGDMTRTSDDRRSSPCQTVGTKRVRRSLGIRFEKATSFDQENAPMKDHGPVEEGEANSGVREHV